MFLKFSIGDMDGLLDHMRLDLGLRKEDIDCILSTILDLLFYYPDESDDDQVRDYLVTRNIVIADNSYSVMMPNPDPLTPESSPAHRQIIDDLMPMIPHLRERLYRSLNTVSFKPQHLKYTRLHYDNAIVVQLE
jgi:hypothetical protein